MCIYTHMLVYTYKCIYTRLHVYLSTVYIFYKLTCSLYIKKREIIFQEDYICFPHGKPKLVHFFFNISSDKFSFHLFCRITLPLHFCEVIEVCPSAVDGIIPLSWVHRILEDTSVSPLHWRAQNWAQYFKCGLTSTEEAVRINSFSLLVTLWMQPRRLSASVVVYQALLHFILLFLQVCWGCTKTWSHHPGH